MGAKAKDELATSDVLSEEEIPMTLVSGETVFFTDFLLVGDSYTGFILIWVACKVHTFLKVEEAIFLTPVVVL